MTSEDQEVREQIERELRRLEQLTRSGSAATTSPTLAVDHEDVAKYVAASVAPNTARARESDWRVWVRWCTDSRVNPGAPSSADVARFLAQQASDGLSIATIRRRLATLSVALRYLNAGGAVRAEVVRATLQGIARTHASPQRRAPALLAADIRSICAALDTRRPKDLRDRAVILVGFYGMLRASELVGFDVGDLEWMPGGLSLRKARSKTSQHAATHVGMTRRKATALCPERAIRAWLSLCGDPKDGPLFRSLDRWGHVRDRRLLPKDVGRLVKVAASRAGLSRPYTSHSLRAGGITEAALRGARPDQISRQSGHRSLEQVATYIRPVTVLDSNVSDLLLPDSADITK